jgi:hypothetical protein
VIEEGQPGAGGLRCSRCDRAVTVPLWAVPRDLLADAEPARPAPDADEDRQPQAGPAAPERDPAVSGCAVAVLGLLPALAVGGYLVLRAIVLS